MVAAVTVSRHYLRYSTGINISIWFFVYSTKIFVYAEVILLPLYLMSISHINIVFCFFAKSVIMENIDFSGRHVFGFLHIIPFICLSRMLPSVFKGPQENC